MLQEQAQTAQWTMEEGSKSAQLAGARKAQGDVVTRLWKLDTEAKRERIRELEQSYLRELEEGKEQASKHSTAGAACKTLKAHKSPRVSTNVSNTESNHDIIKRSPPFLPSACYLPPATGSCVRLDSLPARLAHAFECSHESKGCVSGCQSSRGIAWADLLTWTWKCASQNCNN